MKVLIYLNHPAHFHLFKNVFIGLKSRGIDFKVVCKKKDVLEDLLRGSGTPYTNVQEKPRTTALWSMISSVTQRGWRILKMVRHYKPDLMIGTAFELAHIGKLTGIPFVSVNEDDADMIPLWSKYSYPWASYILSPFVCDNGKWNHKTLNYNSYHELAYLHPDHFTPNPEIVEKYFSTRSPYVIMRFAQLTAHHDSGISGINLEISTELVKILKPHADIYITSERPLESELEPYRLRIDPLDMHHVLSFATLYIGDSQTMAAEAGVLGTPFIRFNDFVGKLGYLAELEDKYRLGYGIETKDVKKLYDTASQLINDPNLKEKFRARRQNMLSEKLNTAEFLTWFIANYPDSIEKTKTKTKADKHLLV